MPRNLDVTTSDHPVMANTAAINTATSCKNTVIVTGSDKFPGSAPGNNLQPARNRTSCINISRWFHNPCLKGKSKNQNGDEPKYQIDADIGHAIYLPGKAESIGSSDSSKTEQFHAFAIGSGRHACLVVGSSWQEFQNSFTPLVWHSRHSILFADFQSWWHQRASTRRIAPQSV